MSANLLNVRAKAIARLREQHVYGLREAIEQAPTDVHLREELELVHVALRRTRFYDPVVGDDWLCPDCWVENGWLTALVPVEEDGASAKSECPACGYLLNAPMSKAAADPADA